jgi:hypothetical protein
MDRPTRNVDLSGPGPSLRNRSRFARPRASLERDPGLGRPEAGLEGGDLAASPGWKTSASVLGVYALVLALATYPMVVSSRTMLPADADPVQHLTVMRWYKACLLEGRSPFLDDGIQHPVGAPIGLFSPMLFQTSLYVILSSAFSNDIFCYNILWFTGFLLTGMGTFLLAYRVVGDAACAGFAGVAAMLSGPMMLHAHGHLELIYVGWFPLFLIAWMRLVDRPGRRTMFVAAASYGLLALSAGYFAVLAVVPAAWYLVLEAIRAVRRDDRAWFRPRAAWLGAFSLLVIPIALIAFSGQIWNLAHGLTMNRSRTEFEHYGVPWYGYVVPTRFHRLGRLLGVEAYDTLGHPAFECASYLGMVILGLILYAAIRRVGPRRPIFWWSVTLLLVVLSMGASTQLGPIRVTLPASWLHRYVFAFRLLRVPGRFNLFACVGAAVLAAAGLKDLLSRWPRPAVRWGICGFLTAIMVADLSMIPFNTQSHAAMPACYDRLVRIDPDATFLDAPLHSSGNAHPATAVYGYWQSFHRGRTTGGYSGVANVDFDNRIVHNTPFSAGMMREPGYLGDLDRADFGIVSGVRVLDFIWLYLTAHDLRYVVLHRSPELSSEPPEALARLESLLAPSRIMADDATTVFDRDLLPTPRDPVLLCGRGWRGGWHGRTILVASKVAEIRAYNADPAADLTFTIQLKAFREARTVRLRAGGVELATWRARPDVYQTLRSPRLRLPAGPRTLTIEADGEEQPRRRHEFAMGGDEGPYSLTVSEISLRSSDAPSRTARGDNDLTEGRLRR